MPAQISHLGRWIVLFAAGSLCFSGQRQAALSADSPLVPPSAAILISVQGTVELMRAGAAGWERASEGAGLGAGDQLRTGKNSRAAVRLSNLSVLRVGELMTYQIEAPAEPGGSPALNFKGGSAYYFSREKPQGVRVRTPSVTGAIRGTEFHVEVATDGSSTFTMIDGQVELTNAAGVLLLQPGDQGTAGMGQAPTRRAALDAINVIQWTLYYPAVIDPAELKFAPAQREALRAALTAYQQGKLVAALDLYPADRQPESPSEHVFRGQLLLAVGLVDEALQHLDAAELGDDNDRALSGAVRQLVAVVKGVAWESSGQPSLASQRMAESYHRQSRGDLPAALAAARQAVDQSPDFSHAWARVADLEFSFGRIDRARDALRWARTLGPENAQALVLQGFLLTADNRMRDAEQAFDDAIRLDGALANGWLGRGLCRIRRGRAEDGLKDLQIAAVLEPNRSVLRSYLGKAFNERRELPRAEHELELARQFDPNDPTPWLYSALLKQQQGRINESIRDLEHSQEINNNRFVYRSRMLLDQDAAVRGANLASIYRDAGMDEVSVREASRAVNHDYANYSAHLFLANSYNELRDPNQINLRYETPWLSEYLVANLLAPVGAGTLSQAVTQQEYSKLFEKDRVGVASSTEYLSRGAWLQSGTVHGNTGNFGFAVDTLYRSDPGQRPNNDQEQLTLSAQVKYDLAPSDSVFLQAIYYDASGGDLRQYYDQSDAHLGLRVEETQEPLLLAGYRHEWSPGVYTLAAVGRFDDTLRVTDTNQPLLLLARNAAGQVIAVPTPALPTSTLDYESHLELYSGELQQIWQRENHTLVAGARYQHGTFDNESSLGASTPTQMASLTQTSLVSFASPPLNQAPQTTMERVSGYGYYYWTILDPLQLIGGLSYDYLDYPDNYRVPPLSDEQASKDQLSPKAGITWKPHRNTTARFGYARSLGGVSFDQSVRLEPTQVAGFIQTYRSLIPEAVAGSTAGASFDTYGLALEQRFDTGTYLQAEALLLDSDVFQTVGNWNLLFPPSYAPSGTPQDLEYTEQNLILTANQLLGNCWSVGSRYRLSRAELRARFTEIPSSVTAANDTTQEAVLHHVSLFALFNHPSGFYARGVAHWYGQSNQGYSPDQPGDEFWQIDLSAGYRFLHRRMDLELGVLNVTDQDYQLNPLNLHADLPRERTFAARLRFNF